MKRLSLLVSAVFLLSLSFGSMAHAVSVTLDSTTQCSAGNAGPLGSPIQISDVSGATDCWGAFDGNNAGAQGADPIIIDGMEYFNISQWDQGQNNSGMDIGLDVTPSTPSQSGDWAVSNDPTVFNPAGFLIVLKAASMPGYGVWLMDPTVRSGTWHVSWGADLSHLTIYAKDGVPVVPPAAIPEPATVLLFGSGLAGLGFWRWKAAKKA